MRRRHARFVGHTYLLTFRHIDGAAALSARLIDCASGARLVDRTSAFSSGLVDCASAFSPGHVDGATALPKGRVDRAATLPTRLIDGASGPFGLVDRAPALPVRFVDGATAPFGLVDGAAALSARLVNGAAARSRRLVNCACHASVSLRVVSRHLGTRESIGGTLNGLCARRHSAAVRKSGGWPTFLSAIELTIPIGTDLEGAPSFSAVGKGGMLTFALFSADRSTGCDSFREAAETKPTSTAPPAFR